MAGLGIAALLSGCAGGTFPGGDLINSDLVDRTRNAVNNIIPNARVEAPEPGSPALAGGAGGTGENASSQVIDGLLARQSVLPDSGPYAQVAGAVLATNSRAAEAELRAAKLRAQAASSNWLPTIGPNLSLTTLSDVVTGLVVDQVLFSNGRKKAERAFAKADVEVAATVLAEDTNDRVYTALELYITAEEARAKARAAVAVRGRMQDFAHVMQRRVQGGVSDRADLQVTRQKLASLESAAAADAQTAKTAIAELNTMSLQPLGAVQGLSPLTSVPASAKPLSVVKAEATRERSVAQATIDRAGFLPTISARGNVTTDGSSAGINVGTENGIGFGTGASLKAIEAAREAANRQVAQADEDSARVLRRLEQQLIALEQQERDAGHLLAQANSNLELFDRQYRAGVRPVLEVVSVYETKLRVEREKIGYAYEAALVRLQIAREQGVLVDGADI